MGRKGTKRHLECANMNVNGTNIWNKQKASLQRISVFCRERKMPRLMCKEVFQLSCRPRKQRWGPRWLPKDGHLQAHSFAGNLSLFTVCFEHLNI